MGRDARAPCFGRRPPASDRRGGPQDRRGAVLRGRSRGRVRVCRAHRALSVRRPRLVYVVTHPVTADLLLRGQLAFMREQGFDVTVIAAPGPELERVREREQVMTIAVPMERANNARK